MTTLVWDQVGERIFETGVDHGVLYIPTSEGIYDSGVAWNGLTTLTESPSGAEPNAQYADNIKYANLVSYEEFSGSIEAFTYPEEWAQCDGSAVPHAGVYIGQQSRKTFGFSYRTRIGNDLDGVDHGYKIHMVWGAIASPSEKAYTTINDSPEAMTLSWDFWTLPVPVTGLKPTSYICVDSTKSASASLAALEAFLYGTVSEDPSLPTPDAVSALFAATPTTVTPTASTYDAGTDLVTIPSVTGVIYKMNGVVQTSGTHAITANVLVRAYPAAGYIFPAIVADRWVHVFA
jgi:hypothetical protein